MPEYTVDVDLGLRIHEVVEKFQENFYHIDPRDILPIRASDNKRLKAYAEVRRVPAYLRPALDPYKVTMIVYDELFYEVSEQSQTLIIIHELSHIEADEKVDGEYVMRDHDVQDFGDMVSLLGLGWAQKVGEDLDVLASPETDWREAVSKTIGRSVENL